MKQPHLIAGILALAATPAFAQEDYEVPPAEGLKSFAVMLGDWEGEGKAWMAAGTEAMSWTASSHVEWILGGHALQEDTKVDFGEGAPVPPLYFRTIYAWDTAHDRPVSYEVSNMGGNVNSTLHWVDPETMVSVSHGMEDGVPVTDRWVIEYANDGCTFRGDRAAGTDAPFTHVKGHMKKSGTSFKGIAMEASAAFEPAPKKLQHLKALAGTYEMTGIAVMGPGMPEMEIYGKEHVDWVLGNHVLFNHVKGGLKDAPPSYEAYGYMYWDDQEDCIQQFYVSNMGETGTMKGWIAEPGTIVLTSAEPMMGVPGADRMVLKYSTEKGMEHGVSHRLNVAGDAQKTFEGKYKKVGGN